MLLWIYLSYFTGTDPRWVRKRENRKMQWVYCVVLLILIPFFCTPTPVAGLSVLQKVTSCWREPLALPLFVAVLPKWSWPFCNSRTVFLCKGMHSLRSRLLKEHQLQKHINYFQVLQMFSQGVEYSFAAQKPSSGRGEEKLNALHRNPHLKATLASFLVQMGPQVLLAPQIFVVGMSRHIVLQSDHLWQMEGLTRKEGTVFSSLQKCACLVAWEEFYSPQVTTWVAVYNAILVEARPGNWLLLPRFLQG